MIAFPSYPHSPSDILTSTTVLLLNAVSNCFNAASSATNTPSQSTLHSLTDVILSFHPALTLLVMSIVSALLFKVAPLCPARNCSPIDILMS